MTGVQTCALPISRGMKEEEMEIIGNCIADVIEQKENAIEKVSKIIGKLCEKFPLYENDII